jgi:hypothetical protein
MVARTTNFGDAAIERLDQLALVLGVALEHHGSCGRRFDAFGRRIVVKPQGAGTLLVSSYLGAVLDAEATCTPERVESIFIRAARKG